MVSKHVLLADEGVLTTIPIGSFTTEAGAEIASVDIAYQRWGEFRGSNVLLIEHALTGDSDVATWWCDLVGPGKALDTDSRSEEHTSELQSRGQLVCRVLLEKNKTGT